MFGYLGRTGDGKAATIADDASDLLLTIDTDDVNPDDVTDEKIQRIVGALNREFYGKG